MHALFILYYYCFALKLLCHAADAINLSSLDNIDVHIMLYSYIFYSARLVSKSIFRISKSSHRSRAPRVNAFVADAAANDNKYSAIGLHSIVSL